MNVIKLSARNRNQAAFLGGRERADVYAGQCRDAEPPGGSQERFACAAGEAYEIWSSTSERNTVGNWQMLCG